MTKLESKVSTLLHTVYLNCTKKIPFNVNAVLREVKITSHATKGLVHLITREYKTQGGYICTWKPKTPPTLQMIESATATIQEHTRKFSKKGITSTDTQNETIEDKQPLMNNPVPNPNETMEEVLQLLKDMQPKVSFLYDQLKN